jgi:hypothetical protein
MEFGNCNLDILCSTKYAQPAASRKLFRHPGCHAPGRIDANLRPEKGDHEIDMSGYYIMPGFINTHVHTLSLNHLQKTPTDYILKLWLINGITSVRDLGQTFHQPGWLLDIKRRSERNEIAGPRIDVYPFFANLPHPFSTVEEAKARIRDFKKQGVDGVKFLGTPTSLTVAGIEEARRVGLRTTIHNDHLQVSEGNAVFLAERGLQGMEHWYGLAESPWPGTAGCRSLSGRRFTTPQRHPWPAAIGGSKCFPDSPRVWQFVRTRRWGALRRGRPPSRVADQ